MFINLYNNPIEVLLVVKFHPNNILFNKYKTLLSFFNDGYYSRTRLKYSIFINFDVVYK